MPTTLSHSWSPAADFSRVVFKRGCYVGIKITCLPIIQISAADYGITQARAQYKIEKHPFYNQGKGYISDIPVNPWKRTRV